MKRGGIDGGASGADDGNLGADEGCDGEIDEEMNDGGGGPLGATKLPLMS